MAGSRNRRWSAAPLWLVVACIVLQQAAAAPTAQQLSGYEAARSAENDANVASYLRYEEYAKHSGVESPTQHSSKVQLKSSDSQRPKDTRVDDNGDSDRRPRSGEGGNFRASAPLGDQPRAPEYGRRQDQNEVYSMVVNMGNVEKSVYISPDVDWLRRMAPRVLSVAEETEDLIRETVTRSMESVSPRGHALVNVINSTVHSMDEIEGTLNYLNGVMQPHQGGQAGSGPDQTRSFPSGSEDKPVIINVFLFNLQANATEPDAEASPSYSSEHDTYLSQVEDLRKASTSRPLSAMELAYLPASSTPAPHYYPQDVPVKLETWVPPLINRDVFVPLEPASDAPVPAPVVVKTPSATPVKAAGLSGMSNRMKAIGYSAIPVMAGLATTWQYWLPAVAAFGRKKRSIFSFDDKDFEELARSLGRAIDPQWLSILMGQRYANSTKAELQSTVENWKNRGKNATEAKTSTARSTTRRSSVSIWPPLSTSTETKTTGTTSRSLNTRSTAGLTEDSTPRFDGWKPSSNNKLWFYNNAPSYSANLPGDGAPTDGADSAASLHILPISTSSEDFDIVANFVRSTLTKMSETTDPRDEQNEVFVFNTPSIVNASLDAGVTSATESVKQRSSTEQAAPLTSAGTTPASTTPTDSPISAINVFTGAAGMPVLPDGITNSPVTFVTVTPPSFISLVPNQLIEVETDSLPLATPTSTSEKSTTTKRSASTTEDSVSEEFVEYATSIYDDDDFMTASTIVEFYDEDTGSTFVAQEIPMPTPAYPSGYDDVPGKRPLPGPFFIDPNEIPARVRPTPSTVEVKSSTTGRPTSTSPVGPTTSPSTKVSAGDLVTIQSLTAASKSTSTSLPAEKIASTLQPVTETTASNTLKFSHGGYVVETTSPPPDPSILVSDVVSTQQMIDDILKVYGTGTAMPVTSQQPGTLMTAANEAEYDVDYYEDTTGMPIASFNLSDFYTTYSPTPEDADLDILALFNQLQTNLTTGILNPATSSGIHFVNTSTDIILLGPFDGVTPASVVEIEPITENIHVTSEPQTAAPPPLQIEAVVAEEDTAAVVVEAVPSLVGAPAPSVPDVSSNANIFLSSSASSGSGITISSGSTSTSTTSSASSGVAFTIFAISLAAAAYVGAVLLPIWLPFAVKKKRRRNYAPARSSYKAPSHAASYSRVDPAILDHNRKNYQEIGPSSAAYPTNPIDDDDSLNYSDSNFDDVGALDDYDTYGPDGYHRNHNYDLNKRRRSMKH